MQNYRKQGTTKDVPEFIPNCIQIAQGGRVKNYVQAAQNIIDQNIRVCIRGSGIACNKVVSIVEILKRQNKNLNPTIEIYAEKEMDEWTPTLDGLDPLIVTRNVPAIKIYLQL